MTSPSPPNESNGHATASTTPAPQQRQRFIHFPVPEDIYIKHRKIALDSNMKFRDYLRAILEEDWSIPSNH